MAAKTYRKKPVEIEAVQWTGDNLDEVMQFCSGNATYELMSKGNSELVIMTLEDGSEREAQHIASRGDWIIRGVAGEFYPCKPEIFQATYEATPVAAPATAISGSEVRKMELPAIWGECAYCAEMREEESLQPPEDLRWDGDKWRCEECFSEEELELLENAPTLACTIDLQPSDITAIKAENERLREAHRHAVALRQCALFAADVGEHIVKAMIDASDFLDDTSAALNGGDHE